MHRVMGLVVALSCSLAAGATETRADSLAWLAGCWAAEAGEPGSGEHWTRPAGGTLLGLSRTVRGGRTVAHEFMQIREHEAGGLVFIASPSGQQEARFELVVLGESSVTFENPDHDFPQRIIYRLELPGRLVARIEGLHDGNTVGSDFVMYRQPCDIS